MRHAPVPLEPSRLRVSLTSGMVGSSMPLMNCMPLAMHTVLGAAARTGRAAGRARVNAAPPALCAAGCISQSGTDSSIFYDCRMVQSGKQASQEAGRPRCWSRQRLQPPAPSHLLLAASLRRKKKMSRAGWLLHRRG